MFDEKRQAFLALPSKDPNAGKLAEQIRGVLEKEGIRAVFATDIGAGTLLTEQIQDTIRRAEGVVADLTGTNPNVMFEVGLAFGLRKPCLLLSQESVTDVPFDLRVHQVVQYRPDKLEAVRRYVEFWVREIRARQETA